MASLPAQQGQQQQPQEEEQQQQHHGLGCDDGDGLDPVLAARLVSHLTLSSSGSEAKEGHDIGSCAVHLPDTISPATPLPIGSTGILPGGQPDASRDGWQKDVALPLRTLDCPLMVDGVAAAAPSVQVLADEEEGDEAGDKIVAVILEQGDSGDFSNLPNEVLLHILSFLEVCDLLATSRTSHHLRTLSLTPYLLRLRLRHARAVLPPMLSSPFRPSLPDLINRHIIQTPTAAVSRRLARNFVSIRLSRHLAARPPPQVLVERCVLPPECVPGTKTAVAPALVARKRAVERERVKDALRRFVGSVAFMGGVREREEGVKKWEEKVGAGRVWRLRRFWEGVGSSE